MPTVSCSGRFLSTRISKNDNSLVLRSFASISENDKQSIAELSIAEEQCRAERSRVEQSRAEQSSVE